MKTENSVLITGGAGTLGKAVARLLLKSGPTAKIVIFNRDEAGQVAMSSDPEFRSQKMVYEIGDIKDRESLFRAMIRHGVDKVIHTAALKHVPIAERQPSECIETNVVGSKNVLLASLDAGVSAVVLVSTDKAAQPTNTYGLSKALMERLVPEFNGLRGTRVVATRFGNLVGSRGSVLELFLRQIRSEGLVTVTDPEMTRFFIRISQAAKTVLHAMDYAPGGVVVVPQMKAAKLVDFVKATAQYASQFHGCSNPQIKVVGPRPGEKKHELVIGADEAPRTFAIQDFLGWGIGATAVPKSALKEALSSENSPLMQVDELVGMISEVAGATQVA